jgi:hypothetical protein
MNHPDIEMLTQFALDDPLALDAATLVHISDCAQCMREVQQIQRVVDATLAIGGRADLKTLEAPPDRVWEGIVAAVDALEAGAQQSDSDAVRPVPVPRTTDDDVERGWLFSDGAAGTDHGSVDGHRADDGRHSRATTAWQLVAAAVIGAVVGAGAMWVISQSDDAPSDQPETVASSTLQGIAGHDASGVVDLVKTESGRELHVDLDPGEVGKGFIQVWLLDEQTQGMVALGVLENDTGTFAVPRDINLSEYSLVDVSLEPFDGDPAHSTVSLARGRVPS